MMAELTEALELLDYAVGRLDGCGSEKCEAACGGHTAKKRRAKHLVELLGLLPAVLGRVRERQMAALRALTVRDSDEARAQIANAERELELMEEGATVDRLLIPGAPPATFRSIVLDGLMCWTLRSELTGELLDFGCVPLPPVCAVRSSEQVAKESCYAKLRRLAQERDLP